jgi:hypothetical protein
MSPSESFKQYAWLSVQLDQYFAAIRIFGFHHDALKLAYKNLPNGKDWPTDFGGFSEKARDFFVTSASALNYMGTTGIFSEAPHPELRSLKSDIAKFGYMTCYSFQWTLFENFVTAQVSFAADRGLLPHSICLKLKTLQRRTEQFLRYLDSGEVFGQSPFKSLLPSSIHLPEFITLGFDDLNKIRKLRNRFMHAAENASEKFECNEQDYERSMWTLRQFAGNIDQECCRLLQSSSG